jgi:hypothetical protein
MIDRHRPMTLTAHPNVTDISDHHRLRHEQRLMQQVGGRPVTPLPPGVMALVNFASAELIRPQHRQLSLSAIAAIRLQIDEEIADELASSPRGSHAPPDSILRNVRARSLRR